MRRAGIVIGILALPLSLLAQEKQQPNQDYAAFSKMVHSMVVKRLPKEGFEDTSGWGLTIPYEPNLPLPTLRTVVKVGDQVMLPHGTWRRIKGKIENPDRDLKIVVKDFKSMDNGKFYRLVIDVDAMILCNVEIQQWQKGLALIGGEGAVDANLTSTITCDVGWSFDFKTLPPDLVIEPKVKELTLNLVDLKARGGPVLPPGLANDVKDLARNLVKASEPMVKDLANDAIAKSLKDGKGTISVGSLMTVLPKPKAPEVKKGDK